MTRPHDPMPSLGVPVNPWTGFPISPVILARVQRYKELERAFRVLLHELDGTTEGTPPGDHRMAQAFLKLDEVTLWVLASLLEYESG